jgi:hypothetical protein
VGTCTSEALSSVIAAGGLAPLLEHLAHLDGGIPNFALTEFSEIHTALIWYQRVDPLLGLRINVGVFALYVLTQHHDQGPVIARLHAYSARAAQHVRLGCRLLHLASSFLFILADGGGLLKAIVGAQASRARARPTGS